MAPKTQTADSSTDWFPDEGGVDIDGDKALTTVNSGLDPTAMTFDELVASLGADLIDINELEPREQFDKDDLVNVPFIVTSVKLHMTGDFGTPWVVVELKTATNKVGWFTDGSTGVAQQLLRIHTINPSAKAIKVPYGLTKSEYNTEDASGRPIRAYTYYLNTAKPKTKS